MPIYQAVYEVPSSTGGCPPARLPAFLPPHLPACSSPHLVHKEGKSSHHRKHQAVRPRLPAGIAAGVVGVDVSGGGGNQQREEMEDIRGADEGAASLQ